MTYNYFEYRLKKIAEYIAIIKKSDHNKENQNLIKKLEDEKKQIIKLLNNDISSVENLRGF